MNEDNVKNSRREFVKASGATVGALAAIAAFSGGNKAEAHEVEINAMGPTAEQSQAFLAMDTDGPVVMVNLLKFKLDGGAAEYAKYGAGVSKILKKIGARILFSGEARVCLLGNAEWDAVALVEYPNKMALINMIQTPEYQAIHHHREAGLEGQVNYAVIQNQLLSAE